ncbi:MAG: O-antigen polymerase, partial [Eubacteriales bacterium]|nr:O-antigen polymerase [Eubacteriales bacterium]
FLIQLSITLIFIIFSVAKITSFMFIIPMFFIYILLDKREPFEKIKLLFILGVCLIGLFVLLNIIRSNFTLSFLDNIIYLRHYLCSGMIVFVEWVEQGFEYTNGIYTFRFPLVVLNKLFHTNFDTLWVGGDYIKNVNIDWGLGNIYTFYHGFVQDFGLWFGLVMSAFIGCIHGLLYNLTYKYKNLFFLVLYSQLMFPLLTQFFLELYFSHISIYLQVIIILFLFTNTKLLYINNNEVLENDKLKSK